MDIVEQFKTVSGKDIFPIIKRELINKSSKDEEFERVLNGSIYKKNSWATRFVLVAIAEKKQNRESYIDFRKIENKQMVWTVEHVFPQGSNIPAHWINMIADGDTKLAANYLNQYGHLLGNLTLSGYNSPLNNKDFVYKRDHQINGKYVGYKNGLSLNEDIADKNSWTVEEIKNRTKRLVQEALEIFSLNG